MGSAKSVSINPAILAWAHAESGYAAAQVARRLQVKEERILAWERGDDAPTFRQLQNLAHFFRRPLSIFFLSRTPQIPPLAAEYRRLPGIDPGHESPELRLALRQMLTRRENALNLTEELGERIPDFALRAHLSESPAEVGGRLRQAAGIDVAVQVDWANEYVAWREWRAAIERLGVLVFQFSKVDLDEVRGLSLLRTPMPVAAINGKEVAEAKSYTLLHETIHLMLAAGNEEAPAAQEPRKGEEWMKVERFAEVAAAHALLPESALQKTIGQLWGRQAEWNIQNVRSLAKKFKLTPLATATRLRESGYLTWDQYNNWREQWQACVTTLPPRRGGFATPMEKAVNRAGRPFAQLVLEALSANRITAVDASRYLDLKFGHFDDLRMYLAQGKSENSSDE